MTPERPNAEKGLPEPPVRLCCGQRHHGAMCPDGKVMCCACFERFNQADLVVLDGDTYDVCKGCEASVVPPAEETLTDVPDDAPPYRDAYEWTRVLPPATTEGADDA